MPVARQVVASLLAWAVGAVLAVCVGLLALSLVGDGRSGATRPPLVSDANARETSASVPSPPSTEPAAPAGPAAPAVPPAPAPRPTDRIVSTAGGTVIVRCTGGLAYLMSWSPREGYRVDNVERGPGERVRVRFRSGNGKVDVRASCAGGAAVVHTDSESARGGSDGSGGSRRRGR